GGRASVEANYYPAAWTVESGFGEVHGEASTFFTAPGFFRPTLALRVGGRQVWGTYPVQEAAFIGGENVRGLNFHRYAGDAAVFGNAELRLRLAGLHLLVPEDFGVFGLADTGRVFLAGEDSRRWHTGVGGGIWLSILRRENTLSVTAAHSEGQTTVSWGAGFGFGPRAVLGPRAPRAPPCGKMLSRDRSGAAQRRRGVRPIWPPFADEIL